MIDCACSKTNHSFAQNLSVNCFWLGWYAREMKRKQRRYQSLKNIAVRFSVGNETVAAWKDRSASIYNDDQLREWLKTSSLKARQILEQEKWCGKVVELSRQNYGHKAISQMLGISHKMTRTILIKADVYQPGKLRHFNGVRVNSKGKRGRWIGTETQREIRRIIAKRQCNRCLKHKVFDLPHFCLREINP